MRDVSRKLKTPGRVIIRTKIIMCNKSNNIQVTSVPVYNQTTKEIDYQVLQFNSDPRITNIVSNGYVLATSTVTEDSKKFFDITLKMTTDTTLPKVAAPTPVNHTVKMTKTQTDNAGIDSATTIRVSITLDDQPVNRWVFDCWVDYFCGCVHCILTGSLEPAGNSAL